MTSYPSPNNQTGAVTLVTAVLLMIAGTVLAFLAARAVLNETKLSANDSRNYQAFQAAQGALDAALDEFNENGGLINSSFIRSTDEATIATAIDGYCAAPSDIATVNEVSSGELIALYYYSNTAATGDRCGANGQLNGGTITGIGWSDDCTAMRTASACLGVLPIFDSGKGPEQPVVAAGGVGFLGSGTVINRYTNITVWSGEELTGNSAAWNTFVRDSDIALEELIDDDSKLLAGTTSAKEAPYAQLMTNEKGGMGVDVVMNDPSLANLVQGTDTSAFFTTFFGNTSFEEKWKSGDSLTALPDGVTSGAYVISLGYDEDGDPLTDEDGDTLTVEINGDYGAPGDGQAMVLVVEGNVEIGAGTEFYGVIYATGSVKVQSGSATIYGSVLTAQSGAGGGSPEIIYHPLGGDGNDAPPSIANTGSIVPGSWRDW